MRSNGVIRRGVQSVTLVAALVGGLTVGAGTSAAQLSADIPPLEKQILVGSGSVAEDSDLVNCRPPERRGVEEQVGDVTIQRGVTVETYPGSWMRTSAHFKVASDETRYIHRYTDYVPSPAYKLRSIRIQWWEPVTNELVTITDPPTSVDALTGAVTLTGAWPISATRPNAYVYLDYDISRTAEVGSMQESGVGFSATGLEPVDWPVMEGTEFQLYRRPITCGSAGGGGM